MISLEYLALRILAFVFLGYLIPHYVVLLMKPRDLRRAYNAKWALVTGSSSGKNA